MKTKQKHDKIGYSTALKKADAAFSKYIHARDMYDGYGKCCSCGKLITNKDSNASHYMSRRYMATRFDEMNVHLSCIYCNKWLAGNIPMYRRFLVERYGEKGVVALENKAQMEAGYSAEDLLFIADEYKKKSMLNI